MQNKDSRIFISNIHNNYLMISLASFVGVQLHMWKNKAMNPFVVLEEAACQLINCLHMSDNTL